MPQIPLHQIPDIPDTKMVSSIQKAAASNKAMGAIMFDAVFNLLTDYQGMVWTIGGRSYFLGLAAGFPSGNDVDIDNTGDATVQNIVDSVVAGIMGDGDPLRVFDAYDAGNNTVGLVAKDDLGALGNAITLVETNDTNTKAVISGATFLGGVDSAVKTQLTLTKTVTADEATAMAAAGTCEIEMGTVDLGALPVPISILVRSSTGVVKTPVGLIPDFTAIAGTEYMVGISDAGAGVLANGDIVTIVLEA